MYIVSWTNKRQNYRKNEQPMAQMDIIRILPALQHNPHTIDELEQYYPKIHDPNIVFLETLKSIFLICVCLHPYVYQVLTISPSSPTKSSHRRRAPSSEDIFNLSKDLLQSGVGGDPGLTPFPAVPRVPAV